MNPINFPESNVTYNPPTDMTEEQVRSVPAYQGEIKGGSLDGVPLVVTAWKPTPEELEQLQKGGVIYASFVGGLPPHFLTTNFAAASNPA